MDPNLAIQFGLLVQAAYVLATCSTQAELPPPGSPLNAAYDTLGVAYTIQNVIYGNEITMSMKGLIVRTVPLGLIFCSPQNDVVVAFRGSEGVWEWLHNAAFLQVKCPFLESAGNTEGGFTQIYRSLVVDNKGQSVITKLSNWPKPIKTLTLCGHSMGAALATLLALDVVANTNLASRVSVYTYASPRIGDSNFADLYDRIVPFTARIANRCDIVPQLPFAPMYKHVSTLFELNPVFAGADVRILPNCAIRCQHIMDSYLYLLSLLPGANSPQVPDPQCRSALGFTSNFNILKAGGDVSIG